MRILFICKYNRFRSKVAEAFFNKFNKNPRFKAESAGTEPDFQKVVENVKKALREFKIDKVNENPRKINQNMIDKAGLIVIVAEEVNLDKYDTSKKKVIKWEISDTFKEDFKGILKRTIDIEKRIKKLISVLK